MRTRLLRFAILPLCCVLFPSCDESSHVVAPRQIVRPLPPPPTALPTGIHLAVGNSYHWRYIRITSLGTIDQWDETYNIVHDTTIRGSRYFIFSTGEILRNVGDTVFSYGHDSVSVYYLLNASVGQAVPFLGHQLAVTFVDTGLVFGKTERIFTVSPQSLSPHVLDEARYASTFGPVEIDNSETTNATRGTLVGARLDTVRYGY